MTSITGNNADNNAQNNNSLNNWNDFFNNLHNRTPIHSHIIQGKNVLDNLNQPAFEENNKYEDGAAYPEVAYHGGHHREGGGWQDQAIRDIFKDINGHPSGQINQHELQSYLESLTFWDGEGDGETISLDDFQALMRWAGIDDNVSADVYRRLAGADNSLSVDEFKAEINNFDFNHDGRISRHEFRDLFDSLMDGAQASDPFHNLAGSDTKLSVEEATAAIEAFADETGQLDKDAFKDLAVALGADPNKAALSFDRIAGADGKATIDEVAAEALKSIGDDQIWDRDEFGQFVDRVNDFSSASSPFDALAGTDGQLSLAELTTAVEGAAGDDGVFNRTEFQALIASLGGDPLAAGAAFDRIAGMDGSVSIDEILGAAKPSATDDVWDRAAFEDAATDLSDPAPATSAFAQAAGTDGVLSRDELLAALNRASGFDGKFNLNEFLFTAQNIGVESPVGALDTFQRLAGTDEVISIEEIAANADLFADNTGNWNENQFGEFVDNLDSAVRPKTSFERIAGGDNKISIDEFTKFLKGPDEQVQALSLLDFLDVCQDLNIGYNVSLYAFEQLQENNTVKADKILDMAINTIGDDGTWSEEEFDNFSKEFSETILNNIAW